MMIFLLLPLLGIAYIAWHIWCLLPCAWWLRVLAIALLAGSFLTMMFGMQGLYDSMPLPVGTALYEIGTSSIFIMMYLVILFLILDFGRLCHIISRTLLYNGSTITEPCCATTLRNHPACIWKGVRSVLRKRSPRPLDDQGAFMTT